MPHVTSLVYYIYIDLQGNVRVASRIQPLFGNLNKTFIFVNVLMCGLYRHAHSRVGVCVRMCGCMGMRMCARSNG